MDGILADINGGNLEQALIRLWLRAESSDPGGGQVLNRWWSDFKESTHAPAVAHISKKLDRGLPLTASDADLPLALITALDYRLAHDPDVTNPLPTAPSLKLDRTYWLVRRKSGIPAERQNPNPERWFRHFRVLPSRIDLNGASISIRLLIFTGPGRHPPEAEELPLRVHISHFSDEVALRLEEDRDACRFRVAGLTDEQARLSSLRRELDRAIEAGARVWVAPELTVPPALRRQLRGWLARLPPDGQRPLLILPGSFHEFDADERLVNRSILLSGTGKAVATHDKLTQFSYARDNTRFDEGIRVGREIQLLLTPIGTVGIAICKDFCDTAYNLVRTAWDQLAPDWILVPSMGDEENTVKAHRRRAEEHWKMRRTSSLVANQEPAFAGGSQPVSPARGFLQGDAVQHPSPGAPAGGPTLSIVK